MRLSWEILLNFWPLYRLKERTILFNILYIQKFRNIYVSHTSNDIKALRAKKAMVEILVVIV